MRIEFMQCKLTKVDQYILRLELLWRYTNVIVNSALLFTCTSVNFAVGKLQVKLIDVKGKKEHEKEFINNEPIICFSLYKLQ